MLSKAKSTRYFLILRLELEFRSLLKCCARQWHFQQKAIFRLENDLIDTIHSFAILNLNGFEVGISRWQHCRCILIEWTDGLSGFEITKPILKYNFRKLFIYEEKYGDFFSDVGYSEIPLLKQRDNLLFIIHPSDVVEKLLLVVIF